MLLFNTLQVLLNQEAVNALVPFLVISVNKCKKWALVNVLKALSSTLYENGTFCMEVQFIIITSSAKLKSIFVFYLYCYICRD